MGITEVFAKTLKQAEENHSHFSNIFKEKGICFK